MNKELASKVAIIKQYNDLMSNTDDFIIQFMNILLNKKVLELSKNYDSPIEVLYFPSYQLPLFSINLFKQINKLRKIPSKLPEKKQITSNVLYLLRQINPILYKVLLDKNIDIYKSIQFDNQLFF